MVLHYNYTIFIRTLLYPFTECDLCVINYIYILYRYYFILLSETGGPPSPPPLHIPVFVFIVIFVICPNRTGGGGERGIFDVTIIAIIPIPWLSDVVFFYLLDLSYACPLPNNNCFSNDLKILLLVGSDIVVCVCKIVFVLNLFTGTFNDL